MAGTVQVTFGANIQQLVDGIDKARGAIDSLKSHFDAVIGVIGADLSVEGIKSYVESMAQLGEQTQLTAATLGVSSQKVVELSGIAALGGQSIDTVTHAFERMSVNIERSTRSAMSPQAQALKVLGLNARELIGLPTDQYFEKLAGAVSKFNPSLNLTAALYQLVGEQGTALIPVMLQGSDAVKQFVASWDAASEGLASAAPHMAETEDKLKILHQAVTSFGARIFSVLEPAIDGAIEWMTRWLESMNSAKIRQFAAEAISAIQTATDDIAAFFIGSGTTVDGFIAKLDEAYDKLKLLAAIGGGAAGGGLIGSIVPVVGTGAGALVGGVAGAITYYTSQWGSATNAAADAAGKNKSTVVASIDDYFNGIKAAIAKGNASLPPLLDAHKLNAGAIDMQAPQELSAQIAKINGAVEAWQRLYQQSVQSIQMLAQKDQITEAQKLAMLRSALDQRVAAQTAALEKAVHLYGLTAQQYQEMQNKLTQVEQQGAADRLKIEEEAERDRQKLIKQYESDWRSALGAVESSFNSQLRGLLAGTETWQMAWRKILGDMVIKFIEMCEQMVVKWGAAQLAQTTAAVTGAAARTAAENSASAAGVLGMLGNAIRAIVADAGQAFAGVFAFLAPAMGPAAAAPAAAAQASVLAAVPSLDVGTDYVSRGGFAFIHEGERITPARTSGPYSGAGTGAQVHAPVSISVSALDSRSVARFFNDNSHHMMRAINDAVKRGAHLGLRAARAG